MESNNIKPGLPCFKGTVKEILDTLGTVKYINLMSLDLTHFIAESGEILATYDEIKPRDQQVKHLEMVAAA